MIKEIKYTVPITRSEVIGEETKTEKVKCCDACGVVTNTSKCLVEKYEQLTGRTYVRNSYE